MRVATIDIGTNTVLLLVAERSPSGAILPIRELATITRLGEGVDRSRALSPAAIERTNACLSAYAAEISSLGVARVAVVGTSAMRDARGSETVRDHVEATLRTEARVISGDEEARLTFRGALSGLDVVGEDLVVFDIGGGSTEFVFGAVSQTLPTVRYAKSFDVGSVRLTERHARHDPPSATERAAMHDDARSEFAHLPRFQTSAPAVGIAGTMTTLAAVHLALEPYDATAVHGLLLSRDDIERVRDKLAVLPLELRRQVPGLEPKRADVILAGAEIALAAMDAIGTAHVRISDRGVRWGLAMDLLDA